VAQVANVLQALGRADAVLIGGQALQVWCDHFVEVVPELRDESPFTSKDVDVQGDPEMVRVCADILSVEPLFPSGFDATNVALLEVPVEGRVIEVNVLTSPFGVKAREAHDTALLYPLGSDFIRVLHPVLCMESRLANVAGLSRTRDQDLRQARASILCARGYLVELACENPRAALDLSERIFRYARDNRHARDAFREHGLDAFAAVDAHPGLPPEFTGKRLPQMRTVITRYRDKQATRSK
jgi:hypothetical protein